jgi:probable F420-dependent oxidoreductase
LSSPALGFALPQTFPGGVDIALTGRILARAEALGVHSVWVQEQIVGATPSLEPVAMLTWAAGRSTRVKLGAAVLLTILRNPVQLAKELSSLDHLSDGRLIVGVGLGDNVPLYPAYGIIPEHRVARFVEGLDVMRALWTKPEVSYAGRYWQLERARMEPKPLQRPHLPLWFGAHAPAAIERAATIGDGFIGAGASSVEDFRTVVATLRAALERAGRDPAGFPIAKRLYVAVDENEDRARRRLEDWFGRFYGKASLAARVAVWGSTAKCRDAVEAIVAAGAGLVILNPVYDEDEQFQRLATEVVPDMVAKAASGIDAQATRS